MLPLQFNKVTIGTSIRIASLPVSVIYIYTLVVIPGVNTTIRIYTLNQNNHLFHEKKPVTDLYCTPS